MIDPTCGTKPDRTRAGQRRSRPVPGQLEDTLGDNVALDLVRTSGDVVAWGAEYMLRPRVGSPLPCVGGDARPEQPRRDVSCVGQASHPCQLADRPFGARRCWFV